MKKMQAGGKTGSRTQVTANGKTRTVTKNEKGNKNYIHTGGSKKVGSDTHFTGKNDKYYYANNSGKVEYSQPGLSKDVDTTGYAAGKKEFNLNTNLKNSSGKKTTTSTKVSRSQVQPMLNRWQSTASKMKTGGAKKMDIGGGVQSKAIGGKGSIKGMVPASSSGKINSPDTVYAPGKKKTESTKTYKTGGSTKYQKGGMKKATTMNPTSRSTAMTALGVDKKNQYSPSKFDDNVTSYARGTGAKKMKTGGMVNSNAGVKKQTVPGSKGVISGENPKASASKVAKGRPTKSTAPKKANP